MEATGSGVSEFEIVLDWSASILGQVEVAADETREHPGLRAAAFRLRSSGGDCYVKIHRDIEHWHSEAHAYERWSAAFGRYAPQLLAVRSATPLAILISALPGIPMEQASLEPGQVCAVWRAAGEALAALHEREEGTWFGACWRDGAPAGPTYLDPLAYLTACFERWLTPGLKARWLSAQEEFTVRAALARLPAFSGERPLPCHRDYGPANWLVTESGEWAGVIDFEFSGWDVRAAEFTRYPDWDWIDHPERVEALLSGYGRVFSRVEQQQMPVGQALYALGAVVWGMENEYYGFAAEGRRALAYLKETGRLLEG